MMVVQQLTRVLTHHYGPWSKDYELMSYDSSGALIYRRRSNKELVTARLTCLSTFIDLTRITHLNIVSIHRIYHDCTSNMLIYDYPEFDIAQISPLNENESAGAISQVSTLSRTNWCFAKGSRRYPVQLST